MMMKRKIVMGLTAFALMGVMTLPVSAQGSTESKDTTIKASVQSVYTLSIPAETQIAFEADSTDLAGALKVSGNVLPSQAVKVEVQAGAFHNHVQNTDLPYTLVNKADGNAFTGDTWDEDTLRAGLEGAGTGKEIQLAVNIADTDWEAAEAGDYEGTITFTADLQ